MSEDVIASPMSELRDLTRYTRLSGPQHKGRERLIRFLDTYRGGAGTDPIVDSLCIHFGLYPYVTPERKGLSGAEALAYEFHRPESPIRDENFVFHAEQAAVFYNLLDGDNVILSAPTSFGKSAILDVLIASGKWANIVVIVPTVALMDEVRRRMIRYADRYNLVTHPSQSIRERNVYVLTQERFLELPGVPDVDLFVIDEFYKLGSAASANDQRMSMLNIAWQRLRATGAQYYLTGPNVNDLAENLREDLRDSLIVSQFRTVAVDVEDRSTVADDERLADMASYRASLTGSSLIFASAPTRAERVALSLADFESMQPATARAAAVADWLAANYHPSWRVVTALQGGVGTHTGPMPRALQRIMIRLFAEGDISSLVCTTTLIEGVNTTARNVIVYDKKIDRKPIDYFTFSNVRGRAGRMSSHFIGRVITYMPPPGEESMELDIPIESQPEDAALSSIVQLSEDHLTAGSKRRLRDVFDQSDLSLETIRNNKGFDPLLQIEAARLLRADRTLRLNLAWSGYPKNAQARAVLEFAMTNLLSPAQRRGMNVNRVWGLINAVRETQGDLRELVDRQYAYKFPNEDLSDVVASVLAFQRNWMAFTIPSLLRATQRIQIEVATSLGESEGNYEFYLARIENLFLPPSLQELDEYGLPLPLALRFSILGMSQGRDTAEVLESFKILATQEAIRGQLSDVELWVVDDVLEGLGVLQGPRG